MDSPVNNRPDIDLEQGFGAVDPWPQEAARMWRSRPRTGRGIMILAIAIAVGVVALTALQIFATWFGPCLHGAC